MRSFARFQDANTGKIAIVSAGIARGGTVAAGEFLTIPSQYGTDQCARAEELGRAEYGVCC